MSSENPLNNLLKKELVQYLHQSGQLDGFLKEYSHTLQVRLHPDRGGNKDLSAIVNGAVSQLRQNPGNLPSWISSMQNGHHPEYEEVISSLIAEVEQLRKEEAEHQKLREQYAKLLASRAGRAEASEVRTASPREGRVFSDPEYESGEAEPEAEEEAPRVRRPSARRVPSEEPAARASSRTERRETFHAELIVLENIVLYDAKGKPAITYKKVTLDGEAVKEPRGSYITKHQDGWIAYFKSLRDGRVLPSLPVYCAIIERLQETRHPAASGLLNDLEKSWLCTSTRINYTKNTITHGFGFEPYQSDCAIPIGEGYLDTVISNKKWRSALQALLIPKDLDKAIETLQNFSRKRSYIWTPNADSRRSDPKRALWLLVGSVRLFFDACYRPVVGDYRSRGVRLEE